jgi:shikimate kinase
MDKLLYMLIGPKGAGKTHIGALVARNTSIRFILVERIWLDLQPGEDGWTKVEHVIDAAFQANDQVMIESLGAGEGFQRFHAALAGKYPIKMIRVFADLDTCLVRVRSRPTVDQIAIPEETVAEYNRIAAAVEFNWDLTIDNTSPASDTEILAAIRRLA